MDQLKVRDLLCKELNGRQSVVNVLGWLNLLFNFCRRLTELVLKEEAKTVRLWVVCYAILMVLMGLK